MKAAELGAEAIQLGGPLSDDSLHRFLAKAEANHMYCQVSIQGGRADGVIRIASGRIVLTNAHDIQARRLAQYEVVELLRKNSGTPGTYACGPLANVPNADRERSVSPTQLLASMNATQALITSDETPAPRVRPTAPFDSHSAANGSALRRSEQHATTSGDRFVNQDSTVPIRASKLRELLQNPTPPVPNAEPPFEDAQVTAIATAPDDIDRQSALRSLIKRLAS